MGSHSVTFHPTQVNTSRCNHSQTGRYSIYLPRRDGRLSWPRWLGTYGDGLPVSRQWTNRLSKLTVPSVEQLRWSRVETNVLPLHHPVNDENDDDDDDDDDNNNNNYYDKDLRVIVFLPR